MILLRMDTWERIRADFTAAEKEQLNFAIVGEAVCPRGAFLDDGLLEEDLREKLHAALQDRRTRTAGRGPIE